MKGFWLGVVLGFTFGICVSVAGIVALLFLGSFHGFHRVDSGHSEPSLEVAQGGDLRVTLGGKHGRSVVFARNGEEFVLSPATGEAWGFPVVSADGRTALFLIRKEVQGGYNYECLVRFDFLGEPLSKAQPQRILASQQLDGLFGGRRSWVNSLHKLSASGDRLLLNISTEDTNRSLGASTFYADHPYWFDLKSSSLHEP